jgi:hypothetical protein
MDMHADMVAGPATKRSPKARLMTVAHLDHRTRASKRACALAAELARGWDGITEGQRQDIDRAAAYTAIAEDLAARRLSGERISMDELLRAEGVARRAVRAIVAERPTKPRGLLRARARWAADEQAKAAQAACRKAPAQTTTKVLDDDQETD